ncbi:MAG TPA: hypothetical protein VFF70_14665, partial [Anaerolineae bacterium]|nr:hypothetical protein [Anaerolineae bacterium]
MNRKRVISVVMIVGMLLAACAPPAVQPTTPPAANSTAAPAKVLHIGYVLHGLNNFTQVIKQGAEDAGRALGVDVEVTGPAGFVSN